jgi:large subunit ribosomal protein L3
VSAIIGKKVGMTQIFGEDGTVVPVTVIEAGPCKVTAVRKADRDGYDAVQLAFGEVKEGKLTKAELGHLQKAGAGALKHLVEFRDADLPAGGDGGEGDEEDDSAEPKVGDTVTVAAFEAGQRVKVSGVSIGKGFQGTVKRHRFARGPVTHGSHNVRAPGSVGASAFPARVFKGLRMPGRMGGKRVTQRGLEVADVDADRNLLLIKGSVPGSRNTIVEVRTDG